MRYAYGVTAALVLGGTALSLSNPGFAQTAQNEPGAITTAAPPRPGAPMSFADLTARLQPAVVNISTEQRVAVPRGGANPLEEFFRRFGEPGQGPQGGGQTPPTREAQGQGSGFIISADGYIVTNNHLVQGARGTGTVDRVTVTLADRREFPARIIGRDPATDLALLKIEGRALPFVNFGDSTRTRVGDWVVAIGNPLGLGGTVTAGIVSAINRNIGGQYESYIQTDAAINRGNSGGPMFDLNGNVVGINTALISETGGNIGIGFAIPASQARPIIDSLRRGQRVARGYLGVGLQPIDDALAEAVGVRRGFGEIIGSVQPGGPAARAGIQQGDVVTRIAGQEVTPDRTLSSIVAQQPAGARVPVELVRDGRRLTVNAVVAARPPEDEVAAASGNPVPEELEEEEASAARTGTAGAFRSATGLGVQALTPGLANGLRLPNTIRGLVVTSVDPSSDAAQRGIQRTFVILSIDGRPVTTPEAAAAAVASARAARRGAVRMLVQAPGVPQPRYVGVELAG